MKTAKKLKEITSIWGISVVFFTFIFSKFYQIFFVRYETKERYFACLLLSECESQSSLKFVIKSLDSHPKLLVRNFFWDFRFKTWKLQVLTKIFFKVWLLDSYSVIVSGQLDEEDKSNDNREAAANAVPSAVSPCKPFPALKLLFKVLNDSSLR